LTNSPPPLLGFAHYPSDFYFLIQLDRPLRRYLDMVEFEGIRLEGSRYVCLLKNKEPQNVVAYVLDGTAPQSLLEMRAYVPPLPGYPSKNPALGTDIKMPPGFETLICFVRKRVLETTTKAGKQIPTRWTVEHAFHPPGVHVEVSLDKETLRVDEELTDAELTAEWPDGSTVFDAIRGRGYSIVGGKRVEADVISESSLETVLKDSGLEPATTASIAPAVTGCGANVLYLALRMLGGQPDLMELTRELGINVNQPFTSVASLANAAERAGKTALAVSAGNEILRSPDLEPVILHVKRTIRGIKEPVDHFILIEGYNARADTVRVHDPPQKPYPAKVASVAKIWTGKAIVFHGTASHRLVTTPFWQRRQPWVIAAGTLLCLVTAGAAITLCRGRKRGIAALLGTSFLLLGCEVGASRPAVRVVGDPSFDFGKVERTNENRAHTFTIENTSAAPVAIEAVSRSCSCIAVDLEQKCLAPGGRLHLRLELETKMIVGKRRATALLRFDSGESLLLSVEATVEAAYKSNITPATWVLLRDTTPATPVRRAFTVTELHSAPTDSSAPTRIVSKDERVSVESMGPWVARGQGSWGYIRECDVILLYRTPSKVVPGDWSVSLEMQHSKGDDKVPVAVAIAPLSLRQL
jgi:hypothetical protein